MFYIDKKKFKKKKKKKNEVRPAIMQINLRRALG